MVRDPVVDLRAAFIGLLDSVDGGQDDALGGGAPRPGSAARSAASQGSERPGPGDAPRPGTGDAPRPPDWDEVAERYGDTVYAMAYRLTGNRDDARDLTQDVFVRVYRNLHRYQPGTFEGWLYRITKNLFLDRVRRGAKVRMEPLPDEEWRQPAEAEPGPAEQMDATVLRSDLEGALEALPPTFRTAVVLCDLQGLSYEEIVVATGWPLGTVRSRIHRGRKLLRAALAGERGGGSGAAGASASTTEVIGTLDSAKAVDKEGGTAGPAASTAGTDAADPTAGTDAAADPAAGTAGTDAADPAAGTPTRRRRGR